MSYPYTYLIGWSTLSTFYYGVRYARNCEPSELWRSYFTSSKYVANFRRVHGEPDVIQVRRTFTEAKDAINWESKVLLKMNAHVNPKFLNRTNSKAISNTPEHYAWLAKFNKERGCSDEHKKILSEKALSPERKAISRATFQKHGNRGVYEVITPQGETIIVRGLQVFCKERGICYSSMSSLSRGNYKPSLNLRKRRSKLCTIDGYSIQKLGSEGIIRE